MDSQSIKLGLQVSGFTAFVTCVLCVFIIWCHYSLHMKSWSIIEALSVLSILLFGLSSVSSSFYFMFNECELIALNTRSFYCNSLIAVWIIAWRIACMLVYILFIKRLQYSFDNVPKYKTPNYIYLVFYILSIMFILSGIIEYVVYVLSYNDYFIIWVIMTVISQIIDSILSIGLMKLYIDKLFLLNIEAGNNENKPMEEYEYRKSWSDSQLKILNVISKITILSSFAVISSQFVFTFQAIVVGTDIVSKDSNVLFIWYLFWDFDSIINAICIFLSFDFNDTVYNGCCSVAHNGCTNICQYYAKKHQRNRNEKEISLMSLQ